MEAKKNKYLFSFSKINKFFIFPFLMPILSTVVECLLDYIERNDKLNKNDFLSTFFIATTLIGGGLSYFIFLCITKPENNELIPKKRLKSSFSIKLIYNDGLKKDYKKLFGFLILMSLIFAIFISFNHIFSSKYRTINSKLFILIFVSIISKIILKTEIFFHQLFSILLSLIGLIIFWIPNLIKMGDVKVDQVFVNLYMIIDCSAYSLFLVLIKYLTHNYYISPYLCLLIIGLFTTIFVLIIFIIYYTGFVFLKEAFDFSAVKNKFYLYIHIFISFFLFSIVQVLTFLIIFYFSPILFTITEIITTILLWIIDLFIYDDFDALSIILGILGNIILLFAVLVYNEIIICNFWDLDKNTTKSIKERQEDENKLYNIVYSGTSSYINQDLSSDINNNSNQSIDEEESD